MQFYLEFLYSYKSTKVKDYTTYELSQPINLYWKDY